MTLYRLKFRNENQRIYLSHVNRNNKEQWIFEKTGILFDPEYIRNEGECYFLVLEEHAKVFRSEQNNSYFTSKENIYENNCSVFLFKDKCYSLGYVNSLFLIPVENEDL